MKHGAVVSDFEREFASYVGARFAVSAANGTVTLQAALVALGVKPGDRVAVPPLTMAATSIAVLNVGAVPVFRDVDPKTWLLWSSTIAGNVEFAIPVSLYGLHYPVCADWIVDDAAQTLREHPGGAGFTSYSLQRSKILQTGEGGMLVTDDEALAVAARSYLSLGYRMSAGQSRIDSAAIKSPDYARHYSLGINGRMNDLTAAEGLRQLAQADRLLGVRRAAADLYRTAIAGCEWLTPQFVPDGWTHDYWTFAVACDTPARAKWLQAEMGRRGAEIPYGCWRLTYDEPAFKHLDFGFDFVDPRSGACVQGHSMCPIAESLQPRLLQFQTNDLASAAVNAATLRRAVLSGGP